MTTVLIVVASRIYREGIAAALQRRGGFDVLGMCPDVDSALALSRPVQPDVILLDGQCAEVRQAMRGLREAAGRAAIVVIGLRETWTDVVQFAEWGAAGYVTGDTSLDELGEVLTDVTHGRLRCPPEVAGALMRRVSYFATRRAGDADTVSMTLTPREQEVLRHIERGSSNKQIAAALGIETSTAKNHVHHVLTKLRARNRGHAAHQARARDHGHPEAFGEAALSTKGSASR